MTINSKKNHWDYFLVYKTLLIVCPHQLCQTIIYLISSFRLTFVVFLLPLKVGSELLNTKIHQIFSYENPEIYMYEDVD